MAGGNGIFGVGISGLLVSQRALTTTGHNVANVNTPGFSRQRVELAARPPQGAGNGFIGTGVAATAVRRSYDSFLVSQQRVSASGTAQTEVYHQLASRVNNLLADPDAGLSPVIQEFFAAVHDLANDPASAAGRQVVLGEARSLVERFHTLDGQLEEMARGVNVQLGDVVGEINALTANVADLNSRIVVAQAAASGQPPNDLLDERDEVIRSLAERINISVFAQDDGALNVAIGTGQALVVGTNATRMSVVASPFEPGRQEVAVNAGGTRAIVSDIIAGGELAGVLEFRRSVLDVARNQLGRVAMGMAATFNEQHRLGLDLKGAPGGDFFNTPESASPVAYGSTLNTGAPPADLGVAVADVAALTGSDYRFQRTGGAYILTRLADGQATTLFGFPGTPASVDGMNLNLASGAIADGDSFLIRPTALASRDLQVAVSAPERIAAALPIRTTAQPGNLSDAQISAGAVNAPGNELRITFNATLPSNFDVVDETTGATLATGVAYSAGAPIRFNGLSFDINTLPAGAPGAGATYHVRNTVTSADASTGAFGISQATVASPDPNLRDPVTITFDNPPTSFTVAGATTGSPTVNVPYTSGAPISFNGWTVAITGSPRAGDVFTVGSNAGGVSDNRNALALAALQTKNTLDGETANYGDAYGQIITTVGTETRQAEINLGAQRALRDEVDRARDEVSGVNLDEEAANLLRYQQAYQASAQVIATAENLFQTLLQVVQ